MLSLLAFIIILLVVIAVMSFINRFTLIRVDGESMSPTLKHGQFLFVDRAITPQYIPNFGERVLKGAIMVYYSPQGKPVIKRLTEKVRVSETETFLWFEGDNKENSIDSRDYGFVLPERIYGEAVNFSTFLKRTFAHKKSEIIEEEIADG